MPSTPTRILAVASGGGHWVQLRRLTRAFAGNEVVWVTTRAGYRDEVGADRLHVVRDANLTTKRALLVLALQLAWIVLRERPAVVVSTGAAPGYLALRLGKLLGARTVWIDSLANVDHLSVSGRHAGRCADLWLTQWQHLARPTGPHFLGAVL